MIRYLQGHIEGAVNLPVAKLFDPATFELLPDRRLEEILGAVGVDLKNPVVLYDSYDGQSAAMVAWCLEYLGHEKVKLLAEFVEKWVRDGREVMYKPIKREPSKFRGRPNVSTRAFISELKKGDWLKLVDARSAEEFRGSSGTETRAGHIPGALNLPWLQFVEKNGYILSQQKLRRAISETGLKTSDQIVTYCGTGPRAAVAYFGLKNLGFQKVKLYDGSFHQWVRHEELPVER